MSEPITTPTPVEPDAWQWWQSRRLGYNLALATAGWAAYGLAVALRYAFGQALWTDWNAAIGNTMFLGIGFLVVMFAANIFYLLGVLVEGWTKPVDRGAYRKSAFALGLWGSVALPFLFPLMTLANLIANPNMVWD